MCVMTDEHHSKNSQKRSFVVCAKCTPHEIQRTKVDTRNNFEFRECTPHPAVYYSLAVYRREPSARFPVRFPVSGT
jgi:hypothetical protein